MAGYNYVDDGDRVFVVQTTRIAVTGLDGKIEFLTPEGTQRTTSYNDLLDTPKTFAPVVGTTKDTAKAGDWKPVWKDIKDAEKSVNAILAAKVKDLKSLKYDATPQEVVDRLNELLNLLRA
ncbi:hypothetical protein FDJ28_gp19 [Pseudomonas phage Bjorn]|uniref:Uncharacterized protein n=1 Tax=Pseudomonas phage Bjorn TaxID=2079288 RepID=A0A2K9VHN3_9CAUD|nr:hypothetical protein FDJ28_gp19 [Pseudomonas phage Bjorn]AUV61765.1 hypothetical protein PsPhBjorn_gp51 [Pseudomonas phage Bjorn]